VASPALARTIRGVIAYFQRIGKRQTPFKQLGEESVSLKKVLKSVSSVLIPGEHDVFPAMTLN